MQYSSTEYSFKKQTEMKGKGKREIVNRHEIYRDENRNCIELKKIINQLIGRLYGG